MAARKAPGQCRATGTSGVNSRGKAASSNTEGHAGTKGHQRPTRHERAHDPDQRRERFARAKLGAAMFVIAERGVIGVVARPVKRIAKRSDHAECEQRWSEPMHLGKQRVLQGGKTGAGDNEGPQAEFGRKRHEYRPDDEAAGQDQGKRGKHQRDRKA
jgi:hypothetical protein